MKKVFVPLFAIAAVGLLWQHLYVPPNEPLADQFNAPPRLSESPNVPVRWHGQVSKELGERGNFVITDKFIWSGVWRNWRPDELIPQVDFREYLVLVSVNSDPNTIGTELTLDGRGNLTIKRHSTLVGYQWDDPSRGYEFALVRREGIVSIEGRRIEGPIMTLK